MKSSRGITVLFVVIVVIAFSGCMESKGTVPKWVQPGAIAVYDMNSAFVKDGKYVSPVQVQETFKVNSVSTDGVRGTVTTYNAIVGTYTQEVTCKEGETPCLGRFWLDPNNPTASIKGELGVPLSVVGTSNIELLGKTWEATTLRYNDPGRMDTAIVYDSNSGLILHYSIKYPTEEIYLTLRSINVEIE